MSETATERRTSRECLNDLVKASAEDGDQVRLVVLARGDFVLCLHFTSDRSPTR